MLYKFKNKTRRLQNSAEKKVGNACFISKTGLKSR